MLDSWVSSIFSDESENFVSNPLPKLNDMIEISFRVKAGAEVDKAFLICWPTGEVIMNKMEKIKTVNGFDYFGVKIKMTHIIFDYRFLILSGKQFVFYTPKGTFDFEPTDFASFRIVADSDYSKWTISGVFYQIFPDRFARQRLTQIDERKFEFRLPNKKITLDRILSEWDEPVMLDSWERKVMQFYGGNFSGITSKMSYLADLGITAIYFTPIFMARSNHRYDIEDYTKPDTLLGTEEELSQMIETAHSNGIKVIFDGVLNHTGLFHKWFDNRKEGTVGAYDNPQSEYRDFYYFHEDGTFDSWFDCKILPQLNHNNPKLIDKLYNDKDSAIKKWLRPPFNIDGWRLDTASILGRFNPKTTDEEFNQGLHSAVKSENPDAYLMGETFYDPTHLVAYNKYEASMNYRGFMQPMKMWLTGQMSFLTNPRGFELNFMDFSAAAALKQMDYIRSSMDYQNQIRMYNLLNSHDTQRFWTLIECDFNKLTVALTVLFTYIGIPSLYYGDEVGMEGQGDPDCRRPMIWDESKQNKQINKLYRTLISLRKKSTVLQRGSFFALYGDQSVLSFGRMLDNQYEITVCNGSDSVQEVKIPVSAMINEAKDFVDFYTNQKYTAKDGFIEIKLAPWQALILMA